MGIKGQDAISCKGGFGVHVRRGKGRILEMERHLQCMREKITKLETMLPPSNNFNNQEGETETDCQEGYCSINKKKSSEDQVCVLQSLAIKQKKLRDEIFNLECKEKEYLQVLSQVNVQQSNEDEMKKGEDNHDFTRADNSPTSRQGESVIKEKISHLEEYSKKLCDCLKSIRNNRKEWSQQACHLSKELNCFESYPGLEYFGDFDPEKEGNACPCGEPVKCNSCIICTCSDWEQDLKINEQKTPEESKELKQKKVKNLVKKKNDCRCFQSSSDSNPSLKSLEISNIYKCSMSKMSIETPSIPSTVDGVILGNEEDKKTFCCLCNPSDDCQKFCEICLCEWEREYKRNQQLYSDNNKCYLCEICEEERFRGGTDLGMPRNKGFYYNGLKENSANKLKPLTPQQENKIKETILSSSEKLFSSTHTSQLFKNFEVEKMESMQNLENIKNAIRKWMADQSQVNINPSKIKIIAAIVDEKKQTPILIQSKICESQKRKHLGYEMVTKDSALGLLILLLIFSSFFLGFRGIFSLSLIFKIVIQILNFPFQICTRVYRVFPNISNSLKNYSFYVTLRNFIFNKSEIIRNFFQSIFTVGKQSIENNLFFTCSLTSFAMIVVSVSMKTKVNFLFGNENCKKISKYNIKLMISSFAKKIMMFFIQPIMYSLILIKFLVLFSLTLFSNLISFCVPQMIRSFSYQTVNSSISIFMVLFKRKSSFLCTSNVICIILGFLLNKVANFNEVKIDLISLKALINSFLCSTPEVEKTETFSDWISEAFKPSNFLSFFNLIIEIIFEFAKMIFQSFEIK